MVQSEARDQLHVRPPCGGVVVCFVKELDGDLLEVGDDIDEQNGSRRDDEGRFLVPVVVDGA